MTRRAEPAPRLAPLHFALESHMHDGTISDHHPQAMATYVYETIPANPEQPPRRFEIQQKMSDAPLKTDPQTGEPVRRIITGGSGLVTHGASILSMKTRGR